MENVNDRIYKNRWLILFNVVLMTFMSCLDSSIVNVALPVMSKKLNVNMASIEWVVTSYLITISSIILIFGRLGDIKGKTKVFSFGIIMFTLGSLMCGLSNSLWLLVAARIIQAIGASATMSTSQGIITSVFPPHERGKALGMSGTAVALGTMVGPPLGGFIVYLVSWKYIFLINVPIGLITFVMSYKILPKSKGNISNERLDLKGAALFTIAIVMMFVAIIKGQQLGYGNPIILGSLLIAMISFTAFIYVEKRVKEPMLELSIFKNKLFSLSVFCGFISFVAISCSNIIQPFYLQDVMKLSSSVTGLFMMVSPLILAFIAPISGHMSDKIGSEVLTFIGLIASSFGLMLMSTLNQNSSMIILIIFMAILSMGNGMFQSPNNSLIMSTVPKSKLGIAGSVNALVRNLGMNFGISLSTALLYNRMSYKIGYQVANFVPGREDVFVYGMRYSYLAASLICAIGAILTAMRLYSRKKSQKRVEDIIEKIS
ncbi:MFS transporter [Clostridium zeae]|uniref:MFS transporter n=1 Tax=Clostridium zeae TaxID=2759022 RepID=A0ABQ1E7B8_9CLOT|nr:MFS transporter [Clostridium zeae]GFZ30680.1 MFS transporter [Clostridium zeae]